LNKEKQKDITYFPLWRERGIICPRRMVESRILYVGMKESMLLFWDYCNQAICILTLVKL
jgi:hypothetical protein